MMTFIGNLYFIMLMIFFSNTWQYNYNLYNTDDFNNDMSHDCIYHMINQQLDIDGKTYETRQVIEYCIRSSSKENNNIRNGKISSILTFKQLKQNNVSTQNLVQWSIPIDDIENYQKFLDSNDTSSMHLIYNCTLPWFGPFCQYKFALNRSFSDIVEVTFQSKRIQDSFANSTCYEYMKCNRGSTLICLDWREICDGKIDCLDEGEDEKNCFKLKMNRCNKNEYQCRNGMCIDEEFLHETGVNYSPGYECLDQSDEPFDLGASKKCIRDPSFQCEETTCPLPNSFTCGDGDCIPWPNPSSRHSCSNNRDLVFNYYFNWHTQESDRFSSCFKIGICASNIFSADEFSTYCQNLCENVQNCKMLLSSCSPYIFAPDFPVWDGHLRLGFFTNQTFIKKGYPLRPHFLCYDEQKCQLYTPTFEINNYTCTHIRKLNLSNPFDYYTIFISCINVYPNSSDDTCSQSSTVHCPKTEKCIPNRLIMDGIPDCYNAFDESVASNSCLLNDKHRFRCTSENKCISITMLRDGVSQCIGNEDETYSNEHVTDIKQLSFSALCDGRQELFSSNNETDETHCEHWPCVNQYTRCNGVWNCHKGIDEINCSSSFNCSKDHHPCVLPNTQKMGCLHIDRVEDGIADCLGSTDERKYCRLAYPNDESRRYRCWNNSLCVDYTSRCSKCKSLDNFDELCRKSKYDIQNILRYFHSMDSIYYLIKLPFSHRSSRPFPIQQILPSTNQSVFNRTIQQTSLKTINQLDSRQAWFCYRGILIYYGINETEKCLCPPSYYGHRCQYQSQRVSLTLRLKNENLNKLDIITLIITLVDHTGLIHSHEQLTYIPIYDCNTKFNIYLLYRDRPKDMTKNYTIRIDAYDKIALIYLRSWTLPIEFLFMPVNRISTQLVISTRDHCHQICNSITFEEQTNANNETCRCQSKLFPTNSIRQQKCNCSLDSLCVGIVNNRSICICPLTKVSARCFMKSICAKNMCLNDGICVPNDDRISFSSYRCVCPDGFSGKHCEQKDVQINISFFDISIPQSILLHFITVREHNLESLNPAPIRATMFKKIGYDQDTITFFMSLPFHLIFAEIDSHFYLAVLQHNYTQSAIIPTTIAQSQYCPHIRYLFNESILNYSILHRVKYYHLACMTNVTLSCFHDNEMFMCLCTEEKHANCFHFDFNMTYNCMGSNECQNGGRCFQDNPNCPTKVMCVCRECYYGTQCQFTTKQFGLSLDAILGYQIRPHVPIHRQSVFVKLSIAVALIMLVVGLVSGTLSIITFQSKPCLRVGCGIYLLISSITSIVTIIFLNLKLWLLILSQMSIITSQSFLTFSCISIDFILRTLLATTDWFHACVAVERLVTVILDVKFNLKQSKFMAKLLIILISLFTSLSFLHDPLHRFLIVDEEEHRTWCMVQFESSVEIFNSFINIFHFVTPFALKFISAISIIGSMAKRRASIKQQISYIEHIRKQLRDHKHLIISSSLLVALALPRLIISFSSGCMKSARQPLIFLIGYFVSFIPCLLTFFIFIATSKTYGQEFKTIIKRKWQLIRSHLKNTDS